MYDDLQGKMQMFLFHRYGRNRGDNRVQGGASSPVLSTLRTMILVVFLVCTVSAAMAAQSILRVPQNHATIQAAINVAVSGDLVLVAPGVYTENINFNGKAVTVKSEGGANVTTIDGKNSGPVVTFANGEDASSKLIGFTLRNGLGIAGLQGGGVYIASASPVVQNNIIVENAGCEGGGVSIQLGAPLIQRNVIGGNVSMPCGPMGAGGILISGEGAAQIVGNVIAGNVAGFVGGGIMMLKGGAPTIQGNIISGHRVFAAGGGLYISDTAANLVENLIVGNSASAGGGVYWLIEQGSGPLLLNNTIADNAGSTGSGIFANGVDSLARMFNNVIVSKADEWAVYCAESLDSNPPLVQFNNVYATSGVAFGGVCLNASGTGGNISAPPLFADPSVGNYRLLSGSPGIDAGSNSVAGLPPLDMDGNTRIRDGDANGTATVDMGAYEFSSTPWPISLSTNGNNLGTFISGAAPVSRIATISNNGTSNVVFALAAIASNDPAAFTLTTGGPSPCASLTPTLLPGASCTVVVDFQPATAGEKEALLVFMADALASFPMTRFTASVAQSDSFPDFFNLFNRLGVVPGSTITSDSITVSGINVPTAISISGGEYSIDGGAYTTNAGTVRDGQTVAVRLVASTDYSTTKSATLTIGGQSGEFSVRTLDMTFNGDTLLTFFLKVVDPGTTAISNSLTVGNIISPVPISITGGEYSINGGPFTAGAGTISNGQSVVVRQTASPNSGATTIATLTIANVSGEFKLLTRFVVPPPPYSPYFPLTVGNSWVTARNGVIEPATTITGSEVIDGVTVASLSDASDGSISFFSNDAMFGGVVLHRVFIPASFIPGCGTVAETDTYANPVLILPEPFTLGRTEAGAGTVTANLSVCGVITLGYSVTSTPLTIERVIVPAGQFDALKVRLSVSIAGIISRATTLWFAAGIGQIKEVDDEGTVIELVDTNVVRTVPDALAFAAQSNVPVDSPITSNPVTISGITASATVAVSTGEYSINGGPFTTQAGSVTNGQSIRVRLTSARQPLTNASLTLTVGGVNAVFTVTTGLSTPAAPTNVTVSSGSGSAVVSFSPPLNNGGAEITGYTATCTSSDGGVAGSDTGPASVTSIRVRNLTIGKRYACTVVASNSLGSGAVSAASETAAPFDIAPILQWLLN